MKKGKEKRNGGQKKGWVLIIRGRRKGISSRDHIKFGGANISYGFSQILMKYGYLIAYRGQLLDTSHFFAWCISKFPNTSFLSFFSQAKS